MKKIKYKRYFFSKQQMKEAKIIEIIAKSQIKRGEGKYYLLHACGCGCGVFASLH